jgi:hypothetical protein
VDLLSSRRRTTGIHELRGSYNGEEWAIYYTGGQRNERRKWIHTFEAVDALIHVVRLDEYDLRLYEDESHNRTAEALELWEQLLNSRWFRKVPVTLVFTHFDLFLQKLRCKPLTIPFAAFKPLDPTLPPYARTAATASTAATATAAAPSASTASASASAPASASASASGVTDAKSAAAPTASAAAATATASAPVSSEGGRHPLDTAEARHALSYIIAQFMARRAGPPLHVPVHVLTSFDATAVCEMFADVTARTKRRAFADASDDEVARVLARYAPIAEALTAHANATSLTASPAVSTPPLAAQRVADPLLPSEEHLRIVARHWAAPFARAPAASASASSSTAAAAATAASPEIVPAKPFAARAQADAVTAVAGMERAFARLSAPEMAGFYFVPPVWYFP